MKVLRIGLILALVLAFAPIVALAAQRESKSFTLDQKATVGTQQLKPGDYKLKWDDSSANTNVTFYRNGKEVATAPAQVVKQKNSDNATYEVNTASGQPKLDRVYTSDQILEFGNSNASGAHTSSTTAPTQ